ncbi:MAG: PAS domain-containing sensor histidine kinase [Cyclobacteriaceae bacterium]
MKELLTKAIFPFMNDESFVSFFQSITEGVLIVDQCGIILNANTSAEKMFGYEEGELIEQLVENLVPSEFNHIHKEHRREYMENPQPRKMGEEGNLEGVKKDGSKFPIEISLSFQKQEGNVFVSAFITDITARKRAELKVTKEKETARQYFDVAEVILMVLSKDGEILEINKKGCEVLGYSEEELLSKNWFDISIEKPEVEPVKKVHKGVLNGDTRYQTHDNHVITKSGEERLIHWQNTVIKNGEGKIVGSLSSGTDMTEKNKLDKALRESEEKLKAYSLDLEKQVEDRTKELAQALETERELSELKSKFVSLASHEFRTPLSAILSSASLVARYTTEETNDKRLKHVDRIKGSVVHLTGILDDFLSVDKLDEGKTTCSPEEFELKELFKEVRTSLKEIGKAGQTLVFNCADDIPRLFTDKKLVRNILINLTSNAIKYTPENKSITVSSRLKENCVLCEVKDEGIGIPEEDHKHLFERFFRASNAQSFQGTGLGLSIVKRYVELIGGKISFESGRGEGTTFTIEFPINL